MNRTMIAAMVLSLAAGCSKAGEGGKDQAKTAAPPTPEAEAKKPFGWTKPFAGVYRSTWGDTVFSQVDDTVKATYNDGSLSCKALRNVLTCTWTEGEAKGKARLTRHDDDTIDGTWGTGDNDTGGGEWTFTPKKETL